MKKTLTHEDIVQGKKYKVIKVPEHLKGVKYPWLDMTGKAVWVNALHNLVLLSFGDCKERGVSPDCLEEVEGQPPTIDCNESVNADSNEGLRNLYEQFGKEKAAEDKQKGIVTEQTAKLNQLYRIVKVPGFWEKISNKAEYPSLGMTGHLIKIHKHFGILVVARKIQRVVPFDCMEPLTLPIREIVFKLSNEQLIEKIVAHPKSTLKIIRGLAKMNKDYRLRVFLDKGLIINAEQHA